MDTKALRQKILDLAIRGKLVPQDPNDEPASVLLERIRAEKQQMVKDGKLKPKDIKNDTIIFVGEDNLHYEKFQDGTVKCIEDEIPFEVPEGWEWTRLNQIYNFIDYRGATPNKISSGVPLITAKNVKSGFIDYTVDEYISEEEYWERQQRGTSHIGDILFTTEAPLGNAAIADIEKFSAGQRLITFQHYGSCTLNNTTFLYFILSDVFQNQLHTKKTGSTVAGIKAAILKTLILPVPSLKEQEYISNACGNLLALTEKIASDKQDIFSLISITKSKILDLAIRGKLVPQNPKDEPASVLLERIRAEKEELIKAGKIKRDKKESIIFRGEDNSYYEKVGKVIKNIDDEIPFTIPDSWKWYRLKAICKKIVDGSHNPPKGLDFVTPYIMASSRNIIENTISDLSNVRYLDKENFMKEHSRTNVEINDILLTTVATLGRSCIYKGKPENLCFQRSVTVITSCILPTYLKLFFDAPYFQNFIVKSATGTAQKGFYLNQLENVLICIPPLAEQDKISCGISSIFYDLDLIEKSLN